MIKDPVPARRMVMVDIEALQVIADYLATRPYREVVAMIRALQEARLLPVDTTDRP